MIVNKIYAPLYNNSLLSINWLPFVLKQTCEVFHKYEIFGKETNYNFISSPLEYLSSIQKERILYLLYNILGTLTNVLECLPI